MAGIVSGLGNKENGISFWEKQVVDVNDIDEKFSNARDMGYLRLNYARSTVVGTLAKYDKTDIYKIQIQSNGKLGISMRSGEKDEEKVLDLSKYESALKEAEAAINKNKPSTSLEDVAKTEVEEIDLLDMTAPGFRLEVYMIKNGREVLVGDSGEAKGTKVRDDLDLMLQGDYRAKKGEYYVKISRNEEHEDYKKNSEMKYAVQMQLGKSYKHDYVLTETSSEDTKNKKNTNVPMTSYGGTLSAVNALQIQATKYSATSDMLQIGYLNMADIYNRNSRY